MTTEEELKILKTKQKQTEAVIVKLIGYLYRELGSDAAQELHSDLIKPVNRSCCTE